MKTDLELYKIFHTVAYHNSISQAAKALYISQPAVSQSIKKLEFLLEIQLFARGPKGVLLTEEGKVFYEYVDKALALLTEGETLLAKLKNKQHGMITIGVSTTLCKHFLLPHLKVFIEQFPALQIKIINKTTFETLQNINQGVIDLGIVSQPFVLEPYAFESLTTIQDTFVATAEYLKTAEIVDPNDIFSKCTFMLIESDNITRQYINQFFVENNILVRPELEINNMDFLIEFAKIGLGVTAVIREFVEKELHDETLVEIPVHPPLPPRAVGIIYDNGKPLSLAAQTFVSFLKTMYPPIPQTGG